MRIRKLCLCPLQPCLLNILSQKYYEVQKLQKGQKLQKLQKLAFKNKVYTKSSEINFHQFDCEYKEMSNFKKSSFQLKQLEIASYSGALYSIWDKVGVRPRKTTTPTILGRWAQEKEDPEEKMSISTDPTQMGKTTKSIASSCSSGQKNKQPYFSQIVSCSSSSYISNNQVQCHRQDFDQKQVRKRTLTFWPSVIRYNTQPRALASPQRVFGLSDFDVISSLGRGKFSEVFLCVEKKLGILCALKVISKKKVQQYKCEELIVNEVKIQTQINYHNIVKVYKFFSDQHNIYIVQQYAGDKTVFQRSKEKPKMDQKTIRSIIRQVCSAVEYLHTRNILHRDLKLENIILFKDLAKICDFGCAVQSTFARQTILGSLPYLSPEQLKEQKYDKKKDVWSIGIMTYELFFGYSPFESHIIKCLTLKPTQRKLPALQLPKSVQQQPQIKDFLHGMLQIDEKKRMSIGDALNHPFLKHRL